MNTPLNSCTYGGHVGHPENEECDRMAVEASRRAKMG